MEQVRDKAAKRAQQLQPWNAHLVLAFRPPSSPSPTVLLPLRYRPNRLGGRSYVRPAPLWDKKASLGKAELWSRAPHLTYLGRVDKSRGETWLHHRRPRRLVKPCGMEILQNNRNRVNNNLGHPERSAVSLEIFTQILDCATSMMLSR